MGMHSSLVSDLLELEWANRHCCLLMPQRLIVPASDIGGDARLELPPASRIKAEQREIDGKVGWWGSVARSLCQPANPEAWAAVWAASPLTGQLCGRRRQVCWMRHLPRSASCCCQAQVYTYIAFPSETTTRSGYQVGSELTTRHA